jgi:MYXO-CTERM domain-containing protein
MTIRYGLAALLTVGAARADGGATAGDAAPDGGLSCLDSGDCVSPLPHCDPDAHVCVECLGHANCASGICDPQTRACAQCLTDGDCPPATPYCDDERNACVECKTDKNCAHIGVACVAGACGSCGDGICSAREGFVPLVWGPNGMQQPEGFVSCPADCESSCPTVDLGASLGEALATAAFGRDLHYSFCSEGAATPDVSFLWEAPAEGAYRVDVAGLTGTSWVTQLFLYDATSTCVGDYGGCLPAEFLPFTFYAAAGGKLLFVVDTTEPSAGPVAISIHAEDVQAPPDGNVDDVVTVQCLDNAAARGETICDEGTRCACEHCPRDYDDCAVIPGCRQVRACMLEKGCVGSECYNSGACRGIIDSHQGISGPAFRASSGLQSCALTFGCALPCDADARGDAGRGQLCAPGREVACTCDDAASGTQVCAPDGSGFGPCACQSGTDAMADAAERPRASADASCGCRVGGPGAPSASMLAALALGASSVLRRRGSRRGTG